MTRKEFIRQQFEAERQIRRKVIPWGWIKAVWFAAMCALPCLLVLLYLSFHGEATTTARIVVFGEFVLCLLVLMLGNRVYDRNARLYLELSVKCPACGECLMFLRNWEAAEVAAGRCPRCQEAIFDS